MKYLIIARHAKWLGIQEEFHAEAQALGAKLKLFLREVSPTILTSNVKRALETANLLASQLGSEAPAPSSMFLGIRSDGEIENHLQPFLSATALLVVCHEENSKFLTELIARILRVPDVEVPPLHQTGTAYVLDCEIGSVTHISH